MKRCSLLLLAVIIIVSSSSCGLRQTKLPENTDGGQAQSSQNDIETIYFSRNAVLLKDAYKTAYKVDLKNQAYYRMDGSLSAVKDWGTDSGDRGFKFVSELSADKVDAFLLESARLGLAQWKDSYEKLALDGASWDIVILFSDGQRKEVHGENDYPETWDELHQALLTLTGMNKW